MSTPVLNEAYLDEKLALVEQAATWSPRLISKLEAFLRVEDEALLSRANPLTFAKERGVPEREAVDLFVHAAKVGLLDIQWHLLCPSCGARIESFGSLRTLDAHFFCALCDSATCANLDDYVEVSFTVSPRVRAIAYHHPTSLPIADFFLKHRFSGGRMGDGGPPFAEVVKQLAVHMAWIKPGEKATFEMQSELGGQTAFLEGMTEACFGVPTAGDPEGGAARLDLRFADATMSASRPAIPPGKAVVTVENASDKPAAFLVMYLTPEMAASKASGGKQFLTFDPFLKGSALLTNQAFRRLNRSEVIQGTEGIGIRDVTVLFTDLKGSTALYERIGDLTAFSLVRQHFDRLSTVVQESSGAIVKTIGDAVMAAFTRPTDAVEAALRMLDDIDRFNDEHGGTRDIVLKIGIHRGASIAVTLNDSLDYFGSTVNIAARVQALADADEIYVTDDVYRSAGVAERLAGFSMSSRTAQLRGIQTEIKVHRAARPI